jgi:hypothetical protein
LLLDTLVPEVTGQLEHVEERTKRGYTSIVPGPLGHLQALVGHVNVPQEQEGAAVVADKQQRALILNCITVCLQQIDLVINKAGYFREGHQQYKVGMMHFDMPQTRQLVSFICSCYPGD